MKLKMILLIATVVLTNACVYVKGKEPRMKSPHAFFLLGLVFTISACSIESLKRTGYETLQNIQKQQCQKELVSECPEQEKYEVYQREIKDFHVKG